MICEGARILGKDPVQGAMHARRDNYMTHPGHFLKEIGLRDVMYACVDPLH